MDTIEERPQNFGKRGSNWRFQIVISIDIHLTEYRPLNDSSYIQLPEFIKIKKAIVNIKNVDNQGVKSCIKRVLNPVEKDPQRVIKLL